MVRRRIAALAAFEDEILAELEQASVDCVDGVHLLLEELETQDPGLNDRCGLLATRHEVFALRIPGCARSKLVVSMDLEAAPPRPCAVHGLVASTARPCEAGRRRATTQFGLIDPVWEPAC